jgi:SAM-dependent methyltransferase
VDSDKALTDLRSWFESTLGAHVLAAEQAIMNQLLPGFFGYDLLQLSLQTESLFDASPIHHKLKMGIAQQDQGAFTGKATQLPFETDSMDVVLLHHLLEYYDSPQQILREVGRIALPSGHVVIIGFNPLSLWGAYRPIGQLRSLAPWCGRFIRPGRLMDWLTLLNFKIDRAQYATYGLPVDGYSGKIPDYRQGLSRNANWPFGAVYVIVASKQVSRLTPISISCGLPSIRVLIGIPCDRNDIFPNRRRLTKRISTLSLLCLKVLTISSDHSRRARSVKSEKAKVIVGAITLPD